MLLPLAAGTSRLRLPFMLVQQQQQQWQQQVQLLPLWRQTRGLKYMPFHNRRKKPRKLPSPPPVFAVDASALAPEAQLLLTDEQQQRQQQEQQQQLSPYQAVQVLQAFLPLQPQQAQRLSRQTAQQQHKQHQQQQQQQQEEEPSGASGEMGGSEEGTTSSGRSGPGPLVYLMLKVRADLKRESVRGVCTLQHGVGSSSKLAVFCSDEETREVQWSRGWLHATPVVCSRSDGFSKVMLCCSTESQAPQLLALGADFAAGDALIQRVAKGWVGFDKAIASPALMPRLLKVARVLGPLKLMPSPNKSVVREKHMLLGEIPQSLATPFGRLLRALRVKRTVVSDLVEAVKGMKSGRVVEFRAEGDGLIKAPVGRTEFSKEQLLENCKCLVSEVLKAQPRSRSGAGEAAASSGKQLQWPPPSFLSRRRQRLSRDADASAEARETDTQGRGKNEDFFISSASLSADGTPEIHLMPHTLHPSSPGYFRAFRGLLQDPPSRSPPFSAALEGILRRHLALRAWGPRGAPQAAYRRFSASQLLSSPGGSSPEIPRHEEKPGVPKAASNPASRDWSVSRGVVACGQRPAVEMLSEVSSRALVASKNSRKGILDAMQGALERAENRGFLQKLIGQVTDDPLTVDAVEMAELARKLHSWNLQNQRQPVKTKLVIAMRHAESKFNVWRRESFTKLKLRDLMRRDWGEVDVPLSPAGREQCKRANSKLAFLVATLRKLEEEAQRNEAHASFLRPLNIDAFLSSPLTRSLNTAANAMYGINWKCPPPDISSKEEMEQQACSDSEEAAMGAVWLVDSLLREKISTMGDIGLKRSALRRRLVELYAEGELKPSAFDVGLLPDHDEWWVPHTSEQLEALLKISKESPSCPNCWSDTVSTTASDTCEGMDNGSLCIGNASRRQLSPAEAAVRSAFGAAERPSREPSAVDRRMAQWHATNNKLAIFQTVPTEDKHLLRLRAQLLLSILCSAKEANTFFLVTHSLFLRALTNDSKFENAEIRAYTLSCADPPTLLPL
ncbi:hypothetical protein Esti_004038 [Eimeria stiedai]